MPRLEAHRPQMLFFSAASMGIAKTTWPVRPVEADYVWITEQVMVWRAPCRRPHRSVLEGGYDLSSWAQRGGAHKTWRRCEPRLRYARK